MSGFDTFPWLDFLEKVFLVKPGVFPSDATFHLEGIRLFDAIPIVPQRLFFVTNVPRP